MIAIPPHRRHAALVSLLRDLTALATEPADRDVFVARLLGAACGYGAWPAARGYRYDPAQGTLQPEGGWYDRGGGSDLVPLQSLATSTSAPGEGPAIRALETRGIEWTADPGEDGRLAPAGPAAAAGVRSIIAVPILVEGRVDALFELFSRETSAPDDATLAVLDYVAAVWGRERALQKLEEHAARERIAAEEELRLHGSAAAHVRDAIVVSTVGQLGGAPTILYVNAAFTRMTGYTEADVLGKSFSVLAGPKTSRDALRIVHERFRLGEPVATEIIAYRKDGTEFLLKWDASPIPEADGSVRHYASIQRDVTEERRVEQALRRADRDSLTGLPTREVLDHRLQLAVARARERPDYRFALLFMDLDGFKSVNDEYGHVVGDQLLTSAARRLEGTIRPGDALARFGGDEFILLLQYDDLSSVHMVAERIQERMSAPFEIQGHSLHVGVSIGVALSSIGYERPEDVVRDADAAMYEAKRRGKGQVVFAERGRASASRTALEAH